MVRMVPKNGLKNIAIRMRKSGKTYSEILTSVPVAKSTLSVWLREVGLAKKQQQRITAKRVAAQKKGAAARKADRLKRESEIIDTEKQKIGAISDRELLLIGTALYWAEGAKSKSYASCPGLDFGNSDIRMIIVYLAWLRRTLRVDETRINLSIYIHETSRHRIDSVIDYWLAATGISQSQLTYIYYKQHTVRTKRKNITNESYFGLLRVSVTKSTNLNRVVQGWTLGISQFCDKLQE